jgi:hypothetical protein
VICSASIAICFVQSNLLFVIQHSFSHVNNNPLWFTIFFHTFNKVAAIYFCNVNLYPCWCCYSSGFWCRVD